jgi:hypothetical protein
MVVLHVSDCFLLVCWPMGASIGNKRNNSGGAGVVLCIVRLHWSV